MNTPNATIAIAETAPIIQLSLKFTPLKPIEMIKEDTMVAGTDLRSMPTKNGSKHKPMNATAQMSIRISSSTSNLEVSVSGI
jgi:hypothetical protein